MIPRGERLNAVRLIWVPDDNAEAIKAGFTVGLLAVLGPDGVATQGNNVYMRATAYNRFAESIKDIQTEPKERSTEKL